MNKILLIIKREYLNKVRKKSFIIMTLLGPVIFAALIIGTALLASSDKTFHRVLIADELGYLVEDEVIAFDTLNMRRPRFQNGEQIHFDFKRGVVDAEAEMTNNAYTDVVQLTAISYTDGAVELFADKAPSIGVQNQIKRDLEDALELYRVKENKIPIETYKSIRQAVNISIIKPGSGGKKDYTSVRAMVGFGFALVIYFFIFFYGVQVMRGVMEEKTNRIVEVIISSVRPFQLMMGKVVGIGLVGLTQFLIWVALTVGFSFAGLSTMQQKLVEAQKESMGVMVGGEVVQASNMDDPESIESIELQNDMLEVMHMIPWTDVILSFILFFIGGYMLYASLFAAIGAMVDNESDTQQFMMPVTLPLVFAYIISIMMLENPEGTLGQVFSLVPFTSPVVMMVKTAIGVPIWMKILSVVILIATFLGCIWLAGRIYRVGILMYGKKPTYREILRWIRYKA
jgi:ABC-2 type transport system permease protein